MTKIGFGSIALLVGCTIAPLSQAQARPPQLSVVGTWHLVRIESPGADGKPSEAPQPLRMLIYTLDGHASVQLMYPQTSLSNEFVHDGYEATFGTYDLNEGTHELAFHVQASATREKLVGKSETLHYDFPDNRHMVIRPTQADQHWFVVWERY